MDQEQLEDLEVQVAEDNSMEQAEQEMQEVIHHQKEIMVEKEIQILLVLMQVEEVEEQVLSVEHRHHQQELEEMVEQDQM